MAEQGRYEYKLLISLLAVMWENHAVLLCRVMIQRHQRELSHNPAYHLEFGPEIFSQPLSISVFNLL